ncbi:MAG: hypothetical protein FWG81_01645 [Betaproteobacteria bacterium]|nr:hypothetical protein [Betaproteobacteria bacterium]
MEHTVTSDAPASKTHLAQLREIGAHLDDCRWVAESLFLSASSSWVYAGAEANSRAEGGAKILARLLRDASDRAFDLAEAYESNMSGGKVMSTTPHTAWSITIPGKFSISMPTLAPDGDHEGEAMEKQPENTDRVIWRPELCDLTGVTRTTLNRWLKNGKLPTPDIYMSRKRYGWRLSTLQSHGVNLL